LLLSIAALSIFSKEMLYWYTLKVAQTYQSTMLKANAWHHRSDALSPTNRTNGMSELFDLFGVN
jgi:divalent metal cation (Fe/Co/Zn/Cd) transporter